MPQRDTSGFGERVPRELIAADFEVALSLVEMAESETSRNNGALARQLLQKAEAMLADVQERMKHMSASQSQTFEARCEELRQAIDNVKQE